MSNESENQLVGRCHICSGPEAASGYEEDSEVVSTEEFFSDGFFAENFFSYASVYKEYAYVASTIVDSDKDVYLVWSYYYQQYVCQLCLKRGQDLEVDEVRDDQDREAEYRRQKMGFKRNYTTNSID